MQSNIDDVPVGGGTNKGPSAEMDEFGGSAPSMSDATGPLEQRIVSKNWSARATAFEELAQLFKNASNQNEMVFKDHACSWKKYLGDSNPGSLEKCLDALTIFIDKADPKVVSASQNEIIKILIEKCVGHAKPNIKTKALECFNFIFEVTEQFDESVETMLESLNSKNQKINQSALVTLNSWLSNYGVKKVKPKPFLTIIENAAGSSVPATRQEAMSFYKESYKWLGDGLKPLLANLKKQQLEDLEKEFLEIKNQPKNVRLTRTEKQKQKDALLDDIIQKEQEETKEDAALDLFEPVDILVKYNAEWQDKILEIKAWKEKKDLLEELLNESNVPKIKPGDFGGLSKVLKKLIGDANVVVSQTAVKVCGTLAKGLRENFEPQCRELLPILIQKFKEKKTQLIEEIHVVLENFTLCSNLENLSQELIAGLQDKAPTVKKNLCTFIEKTAQKTYIDVLQRISGDMVSVLIKQSDDSDGDVRAAALVVLGIFKGRLGESVMSKFLQDLNPQKLAKVNESAQTVKPSKYDRPEHNEKKAQPPPAKAPVKGKAPAAKPVAKKQASQKEEFKEEPMAIDEQPNNFDDMPIGGNKGGNAFDDMPIGGNKGGNGFDDMPIGGGNKTGFDDQPLGGAKKGGYNLDDLDESAFGGGPPGVKPDLPKRKPPAKFAQKKNDEEEKKESDDVQMSDNFAPKLEEKKIVKPPIRAAPEKKTESTKTTTTAKPSGPQIQDEDVGAGLSKEEAENKVNENFPTEIVSKFDDAKWQEKVEGFKGVGEQLAGMNPGADVIEAVAKFVKIKMKDWKESNINLIKETIALLTIIQQNCEKVNKRAVQCVMPFLSDKIGDVKHTNNISEILMGFSELLKPKYIALQVIKYASSAKSPAVLKESCNILLRMTDEFGIMNMPLKEMIDYAIVAVNHSNPQVRTSSMALFAIMYKHAGEAIKNFLKDIKESTMKLIDEEFAKVTPFKKGEFQKKRGFRGEAAQEETGPAGKKGGAGGGGGLDDLLPRADISKLITPKLIPMFKHNDWKVRKEAADKIEEMLRGANMRVQPLGLNEVMDNVKQRMVDPNKAVLKAYLQLICLLVEALGASSKQFHKKLLPAMIQNLADKQSLVRGDTIVAMDKWAEHAGPEVVINIGGPLLVQENPELRTEMLKWIIKNKDSLKTCELKDLIKPLVQCLLDKTPATRNMAEEVITYVMPLTGFSAFQPVISDLLPAVQNQLKPIIEKVKQKCGATNAGQDTMNSSIGQNKGANQQPPQQIQQQQPPAQQQQALPSGPTLKKTASLKPEIKAKTSTQNVLPQKEEAPKLNLNQSLSHMNQSSLLKKKDQTPLANKLQPQRSESKETLKPKGFTQPVSVFKQEEPAEFLTVNFGFKEKRAEFDRKNKFQIEEVKGEQVEKLRTFINQSLGQAACQKMFSTDFKLHIECTELFSQLLLNSPESITEILDIMFKWSCIKLADNNTKFAVAIFDFYATLFQHLEESEYTLWDFEANILIPLLCEKTGLNNNILKDKVKKLFKMIYGLYDKQKCYNLIVQYGLQSKNQRAQAECLDELAEFLIKYGIDYSSEKEMKLVAKMADSADKSVRENALKFMGEAYKLLDDSIWRVIGDVTPKVQGLLEQRFKKLKGGPGLTGSSSQSNFFKPDSQIGREQSPNAGAREGTKTGLVGLKRPTTQQSSDMGKSMTTPRSGLQFQKQPSVKQQQEQAPQNALSKSINQFNSSNRSNEEQKKTPQAPPKKQDMLKKVLSQDHSQNVSAIGQKRALPQTQRPETIQNEFNQVQRSSEPSNNANLKNSFAGYKASNVTKNTQMFYQNDDDDEDLRILTNDDNFCNPELDKLQDEITKHIHQLKYADLSKRVDSLVSLNEMISSIDNNKPVLVRASNDLVGAFTHVLNDIFDKPVEDIPLRFAKYFITIVLKTCSCKEIMREASEERIFDLAEQLLTRLLIENLDKVGDNKEGELILKNLNSSMLRLLENCNHTYIFCVLFNLLRKYKDYPLMPKLPNLIIKCLLKLSKILEKLIDKLDIEKILLAIHEYLVVINHDNKTQNDEMGIRIVKTVTNELVKLKRDNIWEAYRVIQCHNQQDNHIFRWIQIILKSLQTQGSSNPSGGSSASTAVHNDTEIRQIVEELRNPEKFESAIPKLHRFLDLNPHIDLNEYLLECSKTFQQFIKNNLEKHRSSIKEENKQQEFGMMDSMKSTNNSDNGAQNQPQDPEVKTTQQTGAQGQSNRISEYQSKLASIKQRNMKSGAETQTNRDSNSNTHHLNTSFSAMNSSLSQKWNEINKKSAITKRGELQTNNIHQMSSTMTGFSGSTQGNLDSKIPKGGQTQLNQSNGAVQNPDQNMAGGATNQDLNKRLAEMKAKLQALKKK